MVMETKNPSFVLSPPWAWYELAVLLAASSYLAVLPMADTIALRNLALLVLLLLLAWRTPKLRADFRWSWPLTLWALYLLCFPLISIDPAIAWASLAGQWGKGLLALLAGAGAAMVLARSRHDGLLILGVASAVPLLVFLVLFIQKGLAIGAIPWGYWGRETHHADLGYAAGQVAILMTSCWLAGQRRWRSWALAFVLIAFSCTVLARSRAGLVFSVLAHLLVFLLSQMRMSTRALRGRTGFWILFALLSSAGLALVLKDDPRWSQSMTNEFKAGFLGNALKIECEGPASIDSQLARLYGTGALKDAMVVSVSSGDGSRIMAARAGLALAADYPWGSDGSRRAFQRLLRQTCGAEPVLKMAHTHNGWIDTLLAIGWLGAALYLTVLLAFAYAGIRGLSGMGVIQPWALVLAATAVFWILRGFTDSVFRDHMLEMQGFMLAFSATMLRLGSKRSDSSK